MSQCYKTRQLSITGRMKTRDFVKVNIEGAVVIFKSPDEASQFEFPVWNVVSGKSVTDIFGGVIIHKLSLG